MSQNDYGELSDAEIWEIFKAGDKEAFTYIFNQNIRILYKYGHKFAPSMHMVEDYIQELFLTLWKNRSNLSPTDSIRLYLFGALRRNIVQNIKRDKEKVHVREYRKHLNFQLHFDPSEAAPQFKEEENRARLAEVMDKLSPRQREAIYLKYENGFSYDEIASVMGINNQSVRNIVFSALKVLRKHLKRSDFSW